jgi:hypothetical protein
MKVLSVLESTGNNGKTKWEVVLEGLDKKLLVFRNPPKTGENISEGAIELSEKGDVYFMKKSSGRNYQQKDEELILAECAFKIAYDLSIHDGVSIFDDRGVTAPIIGKTVAIARAIKQVATVLKGEAAPPAKPAPQAKPVATSPVKQTTVPAPQPIAIKNVGELLTKALSIYKLNKSNVLEMLGIKEITEVKDNLMGAWKSIEREMEARSGEIPF